MPRHWAGVFNVTLDGLAQKAFCTDINNPISTNKCYKNSAMGVTNPLVACTLQYYPPEDGLSNSEAASRQAAVWYFADGFVVAASDAVKPRADAIIADVQARHAAGECAELAVPRMTLTPPSATNYLVPKAGGGYQPGTHTFTVTVAVGTQPLPDQAVTVSTDRGQLNGIGSSVVVTTGIGGQASVTLTYDAVGVSLISASTQITLPRSLRIDPGPNIQKIVLSGEQPFELKAAAQKEWLAGSVIVVKKFADYNQNGQQDPGEPLINWGVRYRSEPDGEWQEIQLGNDGTATLAVDPNQTYSVCEIEQPDWVLTTEAECISGIEPPRTLLFGNAALRTLLVEKFEDRDGNGLRNQGDILLDGWGFTLYQFIDGVWSNKGSGVTANGGLLGFTGLQAGTYRVVENPLQGWVGSTPTTQEIALVGAETQARLSFGNLQPAHLQFSKSWYDDGQARPCAGDARHRLSTAADITPGEPAHYADGRRCTTEPQRRRLVLAGADDDRHCGQHLARQLHTQRDLAAALDWRTYTDGRHPAEWGRRRQDCSEQRSPTACAFGDQTVPKRSLRR